MSWPLNDIPSRDLPSQFFLNERKVCLDIPYFSGQDREDGSPGSPFARTGLQPRQVELKLLGANPGSAFLLRAGVTNEDEINRGSDDSVGGGILSCV